MLKVKGQIVFQNQADRFQLSVDFTEDQSSLIAIYGKSGAGKTSLLRMIAGLLKPDSGLIAYDKEIWFDQHKNVSPQKRDVGLVFQDYNLFPNMTVDQNISYGIKGQKDAKLFDEIISHLELAELLKRKPNQLSGGQKQRVALARTLMQKPGLLLLDEPLSAIDGSLRSSIQEYLKSYHQKYNLITFISTHDEGEILKLADRIFQIDTGKIVQDTTPEAFFGEKTVSGKVQFKGVITAIDKEDFLYIVSVSVQSQVIKVVVDIDQAKGLTIGDAVMLASKAFNPILYKI